MPITISALELPKNARAVDPNAFDLYKQLLLEIVQMPKVLSEERISLIAALRATTSTDTAISMAHQSLDAHWKEIEPLVDYSTYQLKTLNHFIVPTLRSLLAKLSPKIVPKLINQIELGLNQLEEQSSIAMRRRLALFNKLRAENALNEEVYEGYDDELHDYLLALERLESSQTQSLLRPGHHCPKHTKLLWEKAFARIAILDSLRTFYDQKTDRIHRIEQQLAISDITQEAKQHRSGWQKFTNWLSPAKKILSWLLKGLLGIGLIASLIFLGVQGVSALTITLVIAGGVFFASSFLVPYFKKLWSHVNGSFLVKKTQSSEGLKKLLLSSENFLVEELFLKPAQIFEMDLSGLSERAELQLRLLALQKKKIKASIKTGWFGLRNKQNKKLSEILETINHQESFIRLGLEKLASHIVSSVSDAVFSVTRHRYHGNKKAPLLRSAHLAEMRDFVEGHATDENKNKFKEHTNFYKKTLSILESDQLLRQASTHLRKLSLPFGGYVIKNSVISDFLVCAKEHCSEESYMVLEKIFLLLQRKNILSRSELQAVSSAFSSSPAQQDKLLNAVSEIIFKTLNDHNPEVLHLLKERQCRQIQLAFNAIEERLVANINDLDAFIQGQKSTLGFDIDAFSEMLSLSNLYAAIVGEERSLQSVVQEKILSYIAAYDGRALMPIHLSLIKCLPISAQSEARKQIAEKRLESIAVRTKSGERPALTASDKSLFDMPAISSYIGEMVWDLDYLGLNPFEMSIFMSTVAQQGILPFSSILAHHQQQYLQSQQSSPALEDSDRLAIVQSGEVVDTALRRLCPRLNTEDPRIVMRAIQENSNPRAQFEFLMHIDPARAAAHYLELSISEGDRENKDENNLLSVMNQVATEKDISMQLMPRRTGEPSLEASKIPDGHLETVSLKDFEPLFNTNILFARKVLRDPFFDRLTYPLATEALRHRSYFVDTLLMLVRVGEFDGQESFKLDRDFEKELYELIDSAANDALHEACDLLGQFLFIYIDTHRLEELLEKTHPVRTEEGETAFDPLSDLWMRLLAHGPARLDAFYSGVINYPYGHSVRQFSAQELKKVIVNGSWFGVQEKEAACQMVMNGIGVDPILSPDLIDLYESLKIQYPKRKGIDKFFLNMGISFVNAFSKKRRKIDHALLSLIRPYLYILKDEKDPFKTVGVLFDSVNEQERSKIIENLHYIERQACSKEIKALYVRNRILRRLNNSDQLDAKQRELEALLMERANKIPESLFYAYQSYCTPSRPAHMPRRLAQVEGAIVELKRNFPAS